MRYCLFVPLHNSSHNVQSFIKCLARDTDWFGELLVIDDKSTDLTINRAKAALSRIPKLDATVLQSEEHLGVGACLKIASIWSRDREYDYLVSVMPTAHDPFIHLRMCYFTGFLDKKDLYFGSILGYYHPDRETNRWEYLNWSLRETWEICKPHFGWKRYILEDQQLNVVVLRISSIFEVGIEGIANDYSGYWNLIHRMLGAGMPHGNLTVSLSCDAYAEPTDVKSPNSKKSLYRFYTSMCKHLLLESVRPQKKRREIEGTFFKTQMVYQQKASQMRLSS